MKTRDNNNSVYTIHIYQLCMSIWLVILLSAVATTGATVEEVMGFEVAYDDWLTEAALLEEFPDEDDLWLSRTTTYEALAGGLELVTEANYVKEGSFSGKWAKHNNFPTLTTRNIHHDWTNTKTLAFWAYSERPTGEKIVIAAHSDSDSTLWKDFYYYTITVDWTGWKEVEVPLADFFIYEEPNGWDNIESIAFYTKIFNFQPNPYTVLYLDAMELRPGQASNPEPADGMNEVSINTDLSWTAGNGATSHLVYFGTNSIPGEGEFKIEQTGTAFDPGTLNYSTTYYWRIDEKNLDGTATGDVWNFTTYPEPNIDYGLVAWWMFDEGTGTIAYDSAGNYDGQLINGPTWTTGQIGEALSFDGTDDYVTVTNNPNLNITGDITISAWIWLERGGDGSDSANQVIVAKTVSNGAFNNPFDFRTEGIEPNLTLVRADASGHEVVYTNAPVSIQQWHHVLVRVENKVPDFYVDGVVTGKTLPSFTKTPTGNTNPLLIGRRDNGLYFDGVIDDVRIYDRALSTDEIEQLYLEGLSEKAFNPSPADLATDVSINADLSWTAGERATSHDVYFGTNPSPGQNEFKGNQTETTFDPGTLSYNTTYYWRIDEKNFVGTTTGDVWSFTTTSEPLPPPPVSIIGSWVTGTTHAKESGSNRAIVFIAHAEENSAITLNSVTYGGQTMTKVIDRVVGTTYRAYVVAYILDESGITAATNDTFVPDWSTEPDDVSYASVFLENVNQATLVGATAGNGTANSTPNPITTDPLSTDDGDMVIDAATCGNVGDYTVNNQFIEAIENDMSSSTGTVGYKSATGADETPSVTHSGPNRQVIIGFVVRNVPLRASSPNQLNLATDVSLTADLSWTAGVGATSHDVYFGTASPGTFQGNQQGTTFDSGTLNTSTTYYWRIDEHNAGGTTQGTVWSFTTVTLPWFEGFESGDFAAGGWTIQDVNATVQTGAKYSGNYGAKLARTTWIQKIKSTEGYNTIHVRYRRATSRFDLGEYLYVEWSTDGSIWNNLETVRTAAYADGLQDKTCGTGADNNANFHIRFRTNANRTNEYAYIDDVSITAQ